MPILKHLSVDRIHTDIQVPTGAEILQILAASLARYDTNGTPEFIRELLEARERLSTTGFGNGLAVPHAYDASISKTIAAVAIAPAGVPFEAIDGQPVRLFFSIIGPEREKAFQLRFMAAVARLAQAGGMLEPLISATHPDDFLDVLKARASIFLEKD